MVRDLSWWSSEWDLLSPVKLMQNFEDEDKTVEPNNGAKSLIRATTGPDTPMAKVNEDVSGPSVPLAVDECV